MQYDDDLLGNSHEHGDWHPWRHVEMCGHFFCAAVRNPDGSDLTQEQYDAVLEQIRQEYAAR